MARIYRVQRSLRIGLLAAVFALLAVFKAMQLIMVDVLRLPAFVWMNTHLASEILWVVTLGAALFLLSGAGWRARLAEKPVERPPRKAA